MTAIGQGARAVRAVLVDHDGEEFSGANPLPVDAGGASGTVSWTNPARVSVSAASATDLLAAATAQNGLIVQNVGSNAINIRWDGNNASVTTGLELASGQTLIFERGEVPAGKINGYSTSGTTVFVAYV